MPPKLQEWRDNPVLAHVVPFAIFMLFTELPKIWKIENSELPWYIYSPEQWIYPLQTVLVALSLAFFWKHYKFGPYRGLGLATLLAMIGIVLWIIPSLLYHKLGVVDWPSRNLTVPFIIDDAPAWELLGLGERLEGFDPSFFRENTGWYWSAIIMRFFRMVVVVALIEEIFWRSFLQRYVVNPDKSFTKTPFGSHTWRAYFVTTIAFTLVHAHIDWLACIIYGSLTYYVCVRTKSLAATVLMHAIANLVLGIYTLKTEQWGFW